MKYITAKFDYAAPVRRRISVPLDSECGLAVKTYLNGEEIENPAIVVDGSPAIVKRGWACHDFTTGSQPGNTEFEVEASFNDIEPSGSVLVNWKDELSAVPTHYSVEIPWSDLGISDGSKLMAQGTDLVAYIDGKPYAPEIPSGTDSPSFYVHNGEYAWYLADGKWVNTDDDEVDYIEEEGSGCFYIEGNVSAVHEVRLAGRIQLGQLKELSQKFYVDVKAEDKGYFELSST